MAADDYEREWRQSIGNAVTGFNTAVANLSATLERMSGRLDQHEFRIKHIEDSPAGVRQWLLFVLAGGGCLSMIVGALIGAASMLVGLASLIILLIR
jgi:hypothetical protein